MTMYNRGLPKGAKIYVGVTVSLEEVLYNPTKTDDSIPDIIGTLKAAMCDVKRCKRSKKGCILLI